MASKPMLAAVVLCFGIWISSVRAQPIPVNVGLPVSHTGTAVALSYPFGNGAPTRIYVFDGRN